MWPILLDLNPDEIPGILRRLELEAYAGVVSALRAQGELNKERRKVLNDLSSALNVSIERHKTEVRRACNDELLATVANHLSGGIDTGSEWAHEGRRIIPLLRRATPLTAFSLPADNAKDEAEAHNKQLLPPSLTKSASRGILSPPSDRDLMPPPLSDIVQSNGTVKPPTYAVTKNENLPRSDIVVLPSGTVVRVKQEPKSLQAQNTPEAAIKKQQRKRRIHQTNADIENVSVSYEIMPPNFFHTQSIAGGSRNYSAHPFGNTPLKSGAKRRRSNKPNRRKSSDQSNYSRPISPDAHFQASSALLELEGKIPNSSFSKPIPLQTASGQTQNKMMVLPKGSLTPPQGIPTSISLPKSPVAVSPHKLINPQIQQQLKSQKLGSKLRENNKKASKGSELPLETLTESSTSNHTPRPAILQSSSRVQAISSISMPSPGSIHFKEGLRVVSSGSVTPTTPPGTLILPKPGSTLITKPSPIYMVAATTTGQNLMRVAQRVIPAVSGQGQPRLVTVSTAAFKGAQGPSGLRPAVPARALQPQRFIAASSSSPQNRPASATAAAPPNRPSVIVVQRTPKHTISAGAGQRFLQTKDGKPVMIVSKQPGISGSTLALTQTTPVTDANVVTSKAAEAQSPKSVGSVIVLDLSNKDSSPSTTVQRPPTNYLSDILNSGVLYSNEKKDEIKTTNSSELIENQIVDEIVVEQPGPDHRNGAEPEQPEDEGKNHEPFPASTLSNSLANLNNSKEETKQVSETTEISINADSKQIVGERVFKVAHVNSKTRVSLGDVNADKTDNGKTSHEVSISVANKQDLEIANTMAALADSAVLKAENSVDTS